MNCPALASDMHCMLSVLSVVAGSNHKAYHTAICNKSLAGNVELVQILNRQIDTALCLQKVS